MAKKKSARSSKKKPVDPGMQRINKVLAAAGLGSRRDVEELVVQGRVEIDRETVTDLAFRVDPRKSKIKVDGVALRTYRPVYYALNKPPGILSTNRDPSGRMRVIDLVPNSQRVFSVGRLDRSSEGLILLTNDGELAQRLAHPRYKIQKTYFVVVAGLMEADQLAKLRKGVHLAEGFARIDGATIRKHRKGCTELEIILSEGKNREIRRILARAGHKVVLLRRIAIGTLRLGQMPVGASRELSPTEVKSLYSLSESKPAASKKDAPKQTTKKQKVSQKPKSGDDTSQPGADSEFEVADFESGDFEGLDLNLSEDDEEFGDGSFGDGSFGDGTFGGELLEDDDFVGGFDSTSTAGSVIGADEPPKETRPRKSRGSAPKTSSTRGTQSRSSSRSTGARTGSKTARGRSTTSRGSDSARTGAKSATRSAAAKAPGRAAPKRGTTKKKTARGGAPTGGRASTRGAGRPTGGRGKSGGAAASRGKGRRK